jgi:hypothetical protein
VFETPALFPAIAHKDSGNVLVVRLTSEFRGRTNRAAMITAIRKQLGTCAATGFDSSTRPHSMLGRYQPRVVTAIEF